MIWPDLGGRSVTVSDSMVRPEYSRETFGISVSDELRARRKYNTALRLDKVINTYFRSTKIQRLSLKGKDGDYETLESPYLSIYRC